jgi:DNA polymerase bacteriophage-type
VVGDILSIDIETYSSVDLTRCGVYAYTEAEDFEILLFGYAFNEGAVRVIDLKAGERLPLEVERALEYPSVTKTAFNANFERICISTHFKKKLEPQQWQCTAVRALTLSLPSSLEAVSRCLRLEEKKLSSGKALIKFFSMPCIETKTNGFRTRNLPNHDREKWETFKSYCARDVEVERNIRRMLEKFEITKAEHSLWCLDQKINDRGIKVDIVLISFALEFDSKYRESVKEEAINLTGLQNPNSTAALKRWLLEAEGLKVESLSKETVENLLEEITKDEVRRALKLRQELSKTSIKKYEAMKRGLCRDNYIRGLFQFYGANRTGRWAGRLVQVHNLPQNKLKDLELARKLVRQGQYETLELLFDSTPEVLSQLIRTTFIPSENSRFIIADFSAIEARIIAWLADEKWRREVFNSHGKIYEASAAIMFKVSLEEVTKGSILRQKGKIAELALGYQGGKGALLALGALKMGLLEEELPGIVSAWRNGNPSIVKLWLEVEKAAISSVRDNKTVSIQQGIEFIKDGSILFVKLPSGRKLSYIRPLIEIDEGFNKQRLTYEGVDQTTKAWGRINTYGGKLVENIVQAIARDCLAVAMLSLDRAGYDIGMHVHDEVVLDVPLGFGSVEEVERIMAEGIPWAEGLTLRAEAFEAGHYRKS